MICRYCGKETPDEGMFCRCCGNKLEENRFCPHCGVEIPIESAFCPSCGEKISIVSDNPQKVSPLEANETVSSAAPPEQIENRNENPIIVSEEPVESTTTKSNKKIIILAALAAVVIIALVLFFVIKKPLGSKEKITEDNSSQSADSSGSQKETSSEEPYEPEAAEEYEDSDILPLSECIETVEPFYLASDGDRTEYPVLENSWAIEYFDTVVANSQSGCLFSPEQYFPEKSNNIQPDDIFFGQLDGIIAEYSTVTGESIEIVYDVSPKEKFGISLDSGEFYSSVSASDLQKVFDFFFGEDRFNVKEWKGEKNFYSEDGNFYYRCLGIGVYCPYFRYGLLSVEYEGEEAILTINQVDDNGWEIKDYLSDFSTICTLKENQNYKYKNLMEGFSGCNINIDNLGTLRLRISKKSSPHIIGVEQDTTLEYCVVTANPNLRIRKDASPDVEVLGSVPFGTLLHILEKKNGFACITYEGTKGWVSEEYLFDVTDHYDADVALEDHSFGKDEYFSPSQRVIAVPKGKTQELIIHCSDSSASIYYDNSNEDVSYIVDSNNGDFSVSVSIYGNKIGTSTYHFSNSKSGITFDVFVVVA